MKGLARSLSRGNALVAPIIKRTIPVNAVPLTVDGLAGIGFGSMILGDLPKGNVLILGAAALLQFSGPISASLIDAWEGDFGIGTSPANDATLTGTDINFLGSTSLAAATAEVSPLTRSGGGSTSIVNNTGDGLEVNLSMLIDDASISADGIVMTVNGIVQMAYIMLLDDTV